VYDFLQKNQLKKTLNRFNKIRLYHNYGFMHILPIKYLIKHPKKYRQIQLNTDTHFNAIIMDIDDEDLLTEWNAVGLPTPSIQTLNQNNNKAHLIWLLNIPVSKKNKKAVKYYRAIVNSIKLLINADNAYQNHQTKNFLNTKLYRVTYNDLAYDLDDFKEFIIKDAPYKKIYSNTLAEHESTGSRHIDLFNQLRAYGYQIAKHGDLQGKLENRAELINQQFDTPIKPKAIVKSVLGFCEENKNNFKISNIERTGAMKFKKINNLSSEDYKQEVKKRQKESAARTKDIKRIKTAVKIKVAISILLRNKIKLTYFNLAKQAKVSLSTVKRYSKIVKILGQKANSVTSSIRVIVLYVEERNIYPLKHCSKIPWFITKAPT